LKIRKTIRERLREKKEQGLAQTAGGRIQAEEEEEALEKYRKDLEVPEIQNKIKSKLLLELTSMKNEQDA